MASTGLIPMIFGWHAGHAGRHEAGQRLEIVLPPGQENSAAVLLML